MTAANTERLAGLDLATDVDPEPVAQMLEIGEIQVPDHRRPQTCSVVNALLRSSGAGAIRITPTC